MQVSRNSKFNLQPFKNVTVPSKLSPPRLAAKDSYTPSTRERDPSTMKTAIAEDQPRERTGLGLRKAFGYTLALALGLVGANTSVMAATHDTTVAIQETAVQRALKSSKPKSLLQRLPSGFQARARRLSDAQVKVLKGGIKGETKVGPLKINNRKAFVRGHVMGKKVWPEINKQIRDARSKHGMITSREEKDLYTLINMASKLSKGQRETMAQLMDHVHVR